jgi:hypothetical protein
MTSTPSPTREPGIFDAISSRGTHLHIYESEESRRESIEECVELNEVKQVTFELLFEIEASNTYLSQAITGGTSQANTENFRDPARGSLHPGLAVNRGTTAYDPPESRRLVGME